MSGGYIALAMARFLSLLLTGLVAGVIFSQVLKSTAKATLPGPAFLDVHNVLLRDAIKAMGVIEVLAVITTLVALALLRARVLPVYVLTAAALFCLLLMSMIRIVWVHPLNLQIRHWTPETLPLDWTKYRDRWELYHRTRAMLAIVALAMLILSVLIDRSIFVSNIGVM